MALLPHLLPNLSLNFYFPCYLGHYLCYTSFFRVVELALGSSVTSGHDGLILISHSFDAIESVEQLKPLHAELKNQQTYGLLNRPSIVLHSQVEAKRVVWSPVNFSNDDFDDVRRYRQAGEAGISL